MDDATMRDAFRRCARRAAERVAQLTDVRAVRAVLREEMGLLLVELGMDVQHDPVAQARLDGAMADALSELRRLTGGLPDAR